MANWFLKRGDKESGPGTDDQLRSAFKKGSINADSLVRREDQAQWIKFRDSGILPPDAFNPFETSHGSNQSSSQPVLNAGMFQEKPTYGKSKTPATFAERFVAILIDWVILMFAMAVLSILPFIGHVAGLIVGLAYFIFLQHEWGYTIGRKVMKMHIETPDGRKPDLTVFVIRYFASILSGLILLIGYFLALTDAQVRTLHDKIAGTVVVKD